MGWTRRVVLERRVLMTVMAFSISSVTVKSRLVVAGESIIGQGGAGKDNRN